MTPLRGPGLPAAVQTVAFARDPVGVMLRCRRRFGPVFSLDLRWAGPTVVVTDFKAAQPLVDGEGSIARAGSARRRVLPQASAGSSFGADGERHRELRARIAPALAAERVEAERDAVAAVAERRLDDWPVRRPLFVLSRMRAIAAESFVRLGLGISDPDRAAAVAAAIGDVLRTPGDPPLTPPDRDHRLGRAVDALLPRRLRPLVALIGDELDRRRDGETRGEAILDVLAADASIDAGRATEELLIVMGAAQEAGAIALAWTTIELARDPGLREAYLAAEPGSEARTAIVDEILRLRPAALAALRELTERRTVLGHDLPAGTGVLVPIPLVHLDPARFPSPRGLDPARFAGRDGPDAFMPFGGGPRSCPGEALARLELDVVIPLVLERFDLRFPRRQEHAVQRATVLPPHRGGLAFAFPRSSPGAPAGGPAATGSPSRLR